MKNKEISSRDRNKLKDKLKKKRINKFRKKKSLRIKCEYAFLTANRYRSSMHKQSEESEGDYLHRINQLEN